MKKILFIVGNYYPKPMANGVCAKNLIDDLENRGFAIDVLCFKQPDSTINAQNIFTVKMNYRLHCFYQADNVKSKFIRLFYKIVGKLISVFKKIIFLPFLPFTNFTLSRRFYKKILELQDRNQYYGVVSILNPFDGNLALAKLKKHNLLKTPWVVFCVDTLVNIKGKLNNNASSSKYKPPFWYKYLLKYCDGYIFMQSRTDEYDCNELAQYKEKMIVGDLPMMVASKRNCSDLKTITFDMDVENWSYFGSIGGMHYYYQDLLNFYFSLPPNKKRCIHFFTRGQSFNESDFDRKDEWHNVIIHGYVDVETMENAMKQTDIFISLKYSNQISAKIFQYISYKKPIVHFSGNDRDPDVPYLSKYEKAIVLRTYNESIEEMVNDFMSSNVFEGWVNSKEIEQLYEKNSPRYNNDRILEVFDSFWRKLK